jgi:hypothetical protein
MGRIIFLVAILTTSFTFCQNTFPTNGNAGIGTLTPSASLDINISSLIGAETLLKLKISDASEDYIKFQILLKQMHNLYLIYIATMLQIIDQHFI